MDTTANRNAPDGSVAVPPILKLHTAMLPCPGCTWGFGQHFLNDLDFCGGRDGCGHFHREDACPIARAG